VPALQRYSCTAKLPPRNPTQATCTAANRVGAEPRNGNIMSALGFVEFLTA
jgi:hypothetical protein